MQVAQAWMDLPTYQNFLNGYRVKILLVLFLALIVRVGFVVVRAGTGGDPKYRPTALNILEGHGFSVDAAPPFTPSEASAPVYPVFIAGVYAVFGRGALPLALCQAVLDLFTCLLVAFVSFSVAPVRFKDRAALSALVIYGLLSWPTIVWIPLLLAETLTFFFSMVTIALCAMAVRRGAEYWCWSGVACSLAILTRPDSVLLAMAIGLFLVGNWVLGPSRAGALKLAGFSLALVFALSPWVLRNYISLGKFQPLASEYGRAREDYFPTGYLWWVRTWLKDETHFDFAFDPPWFPEKTIVDPRKLPRDAYDSESEHERLNELFQRYNQARQITPELDEQFRSLGTERIRRKPLRFFFLLPGYRIASLWLTGFSTSHPTPFVLIMRILSVLPIHLGGFLALLIWCRRQPLAALLLLIVLVRTSFMAYHYAPETRYIAEVYPPMIAACGVTLAALWDRVSRGPSAAL